MRLHFELYVAGDSVVHTCDPRVKIGLLFAYTLAMLGVSSWAGLIILALCFVVCTLAAHCSFTVFVKPLVPVVILAACTVLFNGIGWGGSLGIVQGLFLAIRMILLVAASILVSATSTSSELLHSLRQIMLPLEKIHLPTDDIAFTLSLALRFMPMIADEAYLIQCAQHARMGGFAEGFSSRLRLWATAFSALFVGIFRRARRLSAALDARCYGAVSKRSYLCARSLTRSAYSVLALVFVIVVLFWIFL